MTVNVNAPANPSDDPLAQERARLEDTLESLSGSAGNDPAMMLAARNTIVSLGGLARFGAPPGEMAAAVERVGKTIRRYLHKDPGEALAYPLLEARAMALADVVKRHGELANLDADDRQSWVEETYEIFAARDAADAWLLGAAALLRWLPAGDERANLERVRERTVVSVARFDRALEPALTGLSFLRDAAKNAVLRARPDKGYVRRAYYWVRIIEG